MNTAKATQVCTGCKLELDANLFSPRSAKSEKLRLRCKQCRNEEESVRYEKNKQLGKARKSDPEKKRINSKASYERNKEKIKARTKLYREANKERASAWTREWNERNAEKKSEHRARYRAKHQEEIREASKLMVINLDDTYVARRLGGTPSTIPADLIDLKRINLQILRLLKEMK